MKIIIDLPDKIHAHLIALATFDGRKTKPYVERIVIAHVERKLRVKESKKLK
jgi:uncharacterized protein involved in outer membrane biogenesis